jgi:hypothetical protein
MNDFSFSCPERGDDSIHTYNIDSWRAVMGRAFRRVADT